MRACMEGKPKILLLRRRHRAVEVRVGTEKRPQAVLRPCRERLEKSQVGKGTAVSACWDREGRIPR